MAAPMWAETPLLHSSYISNRLGCSAYLKLENLQPSHSFKYRGISLFAQRCKERYGPSVHLVIASGGNAGLAAACAANALGVACSVFLPEGASRATVSLLKKQGADVIVVGHCHAQALLHAEAEVKQDLNAVMVSAFNDPVLWEGHASMITEIHHQLPEKPDAIFCSVGGGGLLGGIIIGCKRVGWDDVPIIALETIGASCFYHSMSINPGRFHGVAVLPDSVDAFYDAENDVAVARVKHLNSRASGSLGASSPAPAVVKLALERKGSVCCVTVPDELSMHTLVGFAEEHKLLVELACSTTLTPAYNPVLFSRLLAQISSTTLSKARTVVFIVCGGIKISMDDMREYEELLNSGLHDGTTNWEVFCDGEHWNV